MKKLIIVFLIFCGSLQAQQEDYQFVAIGSSISLNLVRATYGFQQESGVYATVEGNYNINKYSGLVGYSYRVTDYFTPFIGGGISIQDGNKTFRKEMGVMSLYKNGMITRFGFSFQRGITFAIGLKF